VTLGKFYCCVHHLEEDALCLKLIHPHDLVLCELVVKLVGHPHQLYLCREAVENWLHNFIDYAVGAQAGWRRCLATLEHLNHVDDLILHYLRHIFD
jgi:hypothetical protein